MKTKITICVLAALVLGLNSANAHYLWITLDSKKQPAVVNLVFEGGVKPGDGQYIPRFIARGTTWIHDGEGVRELKMTDTKTGDRRWLTSAIEEKGPLSLASYGRFGVYRYGEIDVQLHYYAKHLDVSSKEELAKFARSEKLELDIVPSHLDDGTIEVEVLWREMPAMGREIAIRGFTNLKVTTDGKGKASFKPEKSGRHTFHVSVVEMKSGHDDADDKDYSEIRHQSTLTMKLPLGE